MLTAANRRRPEESGPSQKEPPAGSTSPGRLRLRSLVGQSEASRGRPATSCHYVSAAASIRAIVCKTDINLTSEGEEEGWREGWMVDGVIDGGMEGRMEGVMEESAAPQR